MLALVAYAAELVGVVADRSANGADGVRRLTDALQARAGVPRVALGRELLRRRGRPPSRSQRPCTPSSPWCAP